MLGFLRFYSWSVGPFIKHLYIYTSCTSFKSMCPIFFGIDYNWLLYCVNNCSDTDSRNGLRYRFVRNFTWSMQIFDVSFFLYQVLSIKITIVSMKWFLFFVIFRALVSWFILLACVDRWVQTKLEGIWVEIRSETLLYFEHFHWNFKILYFLTCKIWNDHLFVFNRFLCSSSSATLRWLSSVHVSFCIISFKLCWF
jgi:hypothetical protein